MDYVSTVVKKTSGVATDWEKYHNSVQKTSIYFKTDNVKHAKFDLREGSHVSIDLSFPSSV